MCEVSFHDLQLTNLDFADDAVTLCRDRRCPCGGSLNEEAEALGIHISWAKIQIQALDALDAAM